MRYILSLVINLSLNRSQRVYCSAFLGLLLSSCSQTHNEPTDSKQLTTASINNTILLEHIKQDVEQLAGDHMMGRDNFSEQIHLAGDYIAKRFAEIGLSSPSIAPDFKQSYVIKTTKPEFISVELNGEQVASNDLAMATTLAQFTWQSIDQTPINKVVIGQNDNMRKILRALNQQGGEHLVLLHPKHQKSFERYKSHFAKGKTTVVYDEDSKTSTSKKGGSIVIVLTDTEQVEQFSITGQSSIKTRRLNNIVGILPGKSKPDEIVIYSAHYDHIGQIAPTVLNKNADLIYNGADDNASGVSGVIALANHFKKMNSHERTLMFIAFSGEELGGLGSRYFSSTVKPNTITAMFNLEMIAKSSVFGEGRVWMTGMDYSSLGQQLNEYLNTEQAKQQQAKQNQPNQHQSSKEEQKQLPIKIYADPYPKQNLFYRSDNATLAQLGVPAHSFSSTQLDKDLHYHQVSDEVSTLNFPSMLKVIKTLATASTPIAQGNITPSRIEIKALKKKGMIY